MARVLLLCCVSVAAAVPLSKQKTFGHSIKNGVLPANTEVTTFEHSCSAPPCVVTHVNVPSIYPKGGDVWNWTQGVVSFYVDGEKEPSISLTLLELAGEGHWNEAGTNEQSGDHMADGSPWGTGLMGRTAKSGAVYSTLRVPFGSSLRTAIRAPPSSTQDSVFWFVLRGLEGHVVRLGDLELPSAARLRLYRLPPTTLPQFQLIDLAKAPSGTSGALVRVHLDAKSDSFGFLEACMRFYPDGAKEPMFLSSGAEDYFLSASYFDEGMFKTSQAGLTYFNRSTNTIAAYKIHIEDPILYTDGMRIQFRNCEQTAGCGDESHCPNQFCTATQKALQVQQAVEQPSVKGANIAEYSTLVLAYEWPKAAATGERGDALSNLQRLVSEADLSQDLEDAATDLVLDGDAGAIALLSLPHHELAGPLAARVARQLRRYVAGVQGATLTQI